ncbi:retinal homeobox protein Rx-like [Ixodes scapularis]|uniref:retinal homeobox protein Rx-like n=1 Tax=Ixodes scapularis TaxID=6945 RepID=UPI001A9F37C4|nr:retinal homeobox protein Rx-like [Ixodes scapularis]
MENLLLWFVLLIVVAACGLFGSWMLCNVRSYLGQPNSIVSVSSRSQMRHPLFADEPQSPAPDVRRNGHHHARQPQPQPPPPPAFVYYPGDLHRYPFPPYFIEPPIDYTPPSTTTQPRRHGSVPSHTVTKKTVVNFQEHRSSSSPF